MKTIFGTGTLDGDAEARANAAFDQMDRSNTLATISSLPSPAAELPPAPISFPPDRDKPEIVAARMRHVPGFRVTDPFPRSDLAIPARPNTRAGAPKLNPRLIALHISGATPKR